MGLFVISVKTFSSGSCCLHLFYRIAVLNTPRESQERYQLPNHLSRDYYIELHDRCFPVNVLNVFRKKKLFLNHLWTPSCEKGKCVLSTGLSVVLTFMIQL